MLSTWRRTLLPNSLHKKSCRIVSREEFMMRIVANLSLNYPQIIFNINFYWKGLYAPGTAHKLKRGWQLWSQNTDGKTQTSRLFDFMCAFALPHVPNMCSRFSQTESLGFPWKEAKKSIIWFQHICILRVGDSQEASQRKMCCFWP